MYALADLYVIHDLKNLVKLKFEAAFNEEVNSPALACAAELFFSTLPGWNRGLCSSIFREFE